MSASTTAPSRALHVWLPLAITGVLVALTLAHPSATRMQTWPSSALAAAVVIFPVGLLGYRISTGARWRVPGLLVGGGLALLAVAGVVSAIASPFGSLSLAQTWPILGSVALCFVLHDWLMGPELAEKNARAECLAQIIAAIGALVGTVSFFHWLITATPSPWLDRNTFPFGHSTYTAGFVVLTCPWIVERIWATRGAQRLAWLGALLTSIGALMGTSSRGGVLVLVAMGGLATVATLLASNWSFQRKLLLVAAMVAIAAAIIATNPRLRELALRRGWGDSARSSNLERSAMLDAGVLLGRERLALGWGPGAVPLAYPRVRVQLDGGNENVAQLHNTPVHLFATLGGIGLLSATLILAGAGVAGWRAWQRKNVPTTQIAALASLAGYLAFSLTDHQFDLPIIGAIAAAGVAVVMAAAAREVTPTMPVRTLLLGGMLALVVAPGIALGRDLLARRAFDEALTAMSGGDTPAVLAALDRATSLVPNDSFFQHVAADWLLHRREKEPSRERQLELTRAALARLEASRRRGVHLEFAHFNLAWLLLDLGRPMEAAEHFRATARLVPDKGGVYFGLGLALLAQRREPDAIRAFALEWLNDPRQSTSPSWEVDSLAPLKPAVRAEALRLLQEKRHAPHLPSPAALWAIWWLGGSGAPAGLPPAFSNESTVFAAALAGSTPAANYRWAALLTAWRDGKNFDSPALAKGNRAFAEALGRRAKQYRTDFREFITAPLGNEPTLALTYRRQRRGYGVLASHPDAPLLTDSYVVQENRLAAEFAANLFPPKGWLPGRFLLGSLPALGMPDGPMNPR